MNVVGFSIIRNAQLYDYPIVEAISSILPLCNKVIVAVGQSEDETLAMVKSIYPPPPVKIEIIETEWDMSLREGGKVLAVETNKALEALPKDTDWAFYIQSDEVVHEKDYKTILQAMERWKDDKNVDGLLFRYNHFYGSYQYVGDSYVWYRKEIRLLKPNCQPYSYRDAQGFRKKNNQKLRVREIEAAIYHYGWVKNPISQAVKRHHFSKLYETDDKKLPEQETYNYHRVDSLKLFQGTHPKEMKQRIARQDWEFTYDFSQARMRFKDKIRRWVEKLTGYILWEYRNYKRVGKG